MALLTPPPKDIENSPQFSELMFCQILEIPDTLFNHFLLDFIVSIFYG